MGSVLKPDGLQATRIHLLRTELIRVLGGAGHDAFEEEWSALWTGFGRSPQWPVVQEVMHKWEQRVEEADRG